MCGQQHRQERTQSQWPGKPHNRIQASTAIPPLPSGSDKIIGGTTFVRGRMLLFQAVTCSLPSPTASYVLLCEAPSDIALLQCWFTRPGKRPLAGLLFLLLPEGSGWRAGGDGFPRSPDNPWGCDGFVVPRANCYASLCAVSSELVRVLTNSDSVETAGSRAAEKHTLGETAYGAKRWIWLLHQVRVCGERASARAENPSSGNPGVGWSALCRRRQATSRLRRRNLWHGRQKCPCPPNPGIEAGPEGRLTRRAEASLLARPTRLDGHDHWKCAANTDPWHDQDCSARLLTMAEASGNGHHSPVLLI